MEITRKARALINAIEECGASVKLTQAVILAGELATDVEFEERYVVALEKNWIAPPRDAEWLSKHAWNFYWQQCEQYEKDPSSGRPVPPHRSGGAVENTKTI